MIQLLRRNLLYSEKRVRDVLFAAVRETLEINAGNGTAVTLFRLTREAAALSRERGERAGTESGNWEMAAKAVLNTMLHARVLLDSGGRIVLPGVGAHAAEIAGVRDGYERTSEAFLLEFLIRKLGDVSTRDHTALAHALLRQFDARVPIYELEDQVVMLLAKLPGSIILAEDGTYLPSVAF
jgi:hypothetical protein